MNEPILALRKPVSVVPQSPPTIEEKVRAFLEVPLPSDFKIEAGTEVTFLNYDPDITGLILERRPFIWIDRCIAIKTEGANGKPLYTVWGVARMTEELSEGHFPGRPIVPLINLCRVIAQVGIIASALQAGDPTKSPIGIASGHSTADARDLIDAPATVLARVSVTAYKLGLCNFGPGTVYHKGEQVGTLAYMKYLMQPRNVLLSSRK